MKTTDISRVKSLIKSRNYSEALELCNSLYHEGSSDSIQVLRMRAHVYSMAGDYGSAISDYRIIMESGSAELRDWYLAANSALESKRYTDVVELFSEVIRLGELQGETWFRSASLFYLAYGLLMTGRPEDAMNSLSMAVAMESDIKLYLPGLGVSNAERLKHEIMKRINGS